MRGRTVLTVVSTVLVATLMLAGCGGDDDGSVDTPEEATRALLVAYADQDAEATCALLSERAIAEMEGDGECVDKVILTGFTETTDEDRQKIEDSSYEVTDQTDDSATVTVTSPDGEEVSFQLVVEDDQWKLEDTN